MSFFRRSFSANAKPKAEAPAPVSMLNVEYRPPIKSGSCPCCNGVTITLNRLVKRDGFPHAMCRVTFSETHLDDPARGIIGIGMFGEGTEPHQRVAFGVLLRPDGVMVIDATEAEWPNTEILGPKLSRTDALEHPRKADLFCLMDKIYAEDQLLIEHFKKIASRSA